MRALHAAEITEAVARLCIQANTRLSSDAEAALRDACAREPWPGAKGILSDLCANLDLARETGLPICQDTGIVTVFAELGQDVHITGGDFESAVQEGVRRGYAEGYLRKSVVSDPLRRVNTGDNTPAAVCVRIVPGEHVKLTVSPKGAGSENMCRVKMLTPAMGEAGVREFVLETVRAAGGNPCPPIVVGVGIGGGFDSVAALARRALLRPLDSANGDEFYAAMERELLADINATGIGPQGLGGATTALAVLVEAAPTHIAMLPAAVCICCHADRHAGEVL